MDTDTIMDTETTMDTEALMGAEPVARRPEAKKGNVIIRAATLADRGRMKQLWRGAFGENVFGGDRTHDAYLHWAFERNPHRRPDSTTQWVAELDGEVIAAWSTMPVRLMVRGEAISAIWSQNVAVASEARGLGVARKLFHRVIAHHRMALAAGIVTATRTLAAAEGSRFVRADRFAVLLLRPGDLLGSMWRSAYHRDLPTAWRMVHSIYARSLRVRRRNPSHVQVSEVPRLPSALDAFLGRVADAIPVMTHRNVERLNWMLMNPRIECTALIASDRGRLCGYAILRHDGLIIELLAHPDDPASFQALVAESMRWARSRGLRKLSGIVPEIPGLARAFAGCGFVAVEGVDFGLHFARCEDQSMCDTLSNPQHWYLSMADSDLWSYALS